VLEAPDLPFEERRPCQRCGSTSRAHSSHIHESLNAKDSLGLKLRRPGFKKPIYEEKAGPSLSTKTGQMNNRLMVVDRLGDRYRELVTDPRTGEVLHCADELLSEHRGHGSAKPRSPSTA
jgi:hypothetical protein